MNLRLPKSHPKQVTQLMPRRSVVVQFLLLFAVVVMNQAHGTEKDPNRCIDRVKVYVNDETQTFFSKMIIDNLKRRLEDIDSVNTAKLTEEQKIRKDKWVTPRIAEELAEGREVPPKDKQQKEFEMRTSWKGGVKDLIFIDRVAKEAELDKTSINLRLYRKKKRPRFVVRGGTCSYKSSKRTTMIKAMPEKTAGSKQNYHDLASFVAHQLIALSEIEGCNLGSEAKPLLIGITANTKVNPLPMGVQLRTYEASASEEERHERITFPGQFPDKAVLGAAEIDVFNRPTDFAYALKHPLKIDKWREVRVWSLDDEAICDLFDKRQTVVTDQLETITFDVPEAELDSAELEIQIDPGSSFYQQHPNMAFKVRWYSDDEKQRLVSESALVKMSNQIITDESVAIKLVGFPSVLLPGTYVVELIWYKDEDVPASKATSFHWNSTLNHNVGSVRGLLGPKILKSMRGGVRGATRIMENYYLQQRVTRRFLRWESWPEKNALRFADGILWYFEKTKELPYLSQWEGEQGVAAELVRALNAVIDDEDRIFEQDAQLALNYLGRLPSRPANFKKRELRSAMCNLVDGLQKKGEATPLWMDCDG